MYLNQIKNTTLDSSIKKELSRKQIIDIAKKFKDIIDDKLKPISSGMTKIHNFQFYGEISPP